MKEQINLLIQRIKRINPYVLALILLLIIGVVCYFEWLYIKHCFEIRGQYPHIGGIGVVFYLLIGLLLLIINGTLLKVIKTSILLNFTILYMIFGIIIIAELYNKIIIPHIENTYFANKLKCVGVVYFKANHLRYRSHHYIVKTGVDSVHTCEQRVPEDSPLLNTIHVGDAVILCVSDKYPRVNKVLNWHPTHEEIEKYRTPVKLIEK